MWLNEIVSQNMFIERVNKQSLELEAARNRNSELLKKSQRLEQEQNNLTDLFTSNQLDVITKKNNLNALLANLKEQKRLNLMATQRLEICREQINHIQENIEQTNGGMFDSVTELKPIKEKLSFKWDVVECLQQKLVETRLQNAEKEAIIIELRLCEHDLKNEVELLKEDEKETLPINKLQEQFLAARLRDADVVLEFDKLKRSLAAIKHELEEKRTETELEMKRENQDPFHIHFNLRDKYHEQIKFEENESIARTVEFQDEIDYLKMQIKKLEHIKQDIIARVHFNEEVKVHLHEVKTSIFVRLQKTSVELEKIIEKNRKLEEKMTSDLSDIQHNIDDKDTLISQLAQDIKELQLRNDKSAKYNDESMASITDITINKLQEEIEFLEEKIRTLTIP
ncbi:uveal autoantigen with coiled-coil domains and ankyrin repeats-like [Anoplophora glabripennis]|uniref:uveal autoantigen with coiled-coil domains and ankyrin repeats-like n=1 Tax=Anoplophora glabripennis TaxID=217634 RepID=UPI000874E5EB|nr:uveal autoantigen with coiled-coil domains and ankyrin repeats-like [Anoplophora glabripennis]